MLYIFGVWQCHWLAQDLDSPCKLGRTLFWVAMNELPKTVVLNVLHVLWYVMNMSNHQSATATNCSFTDKRELPRYLPSCRSEQCQNMGKLELEMDALPMDSGQQTIVKVSHNWLNQTKCSESAPILIHTLTNIYIYIWYLSLVFRFWSPGFQAQHEIFEGHIPRVEQKVRGLAGLLVLVLPRVWHVWAKLMSIMIWQYMNVCKI